MIVSDVFTRLGFHIVFGERESIALLTYTLCVVVSVVVLPVARGPYVSVEALLTWPG